MDINMIFNKVGYNIKSEKQQKAFDELNKD